jgi:hypothetical protein
MCDENWLGHLREINRDKRRKFQNREILGGRRRRAAGAA